MIYHYVSLFPNFGICKTISMLPTYILTNNQTKKKVALTNARAAHDLYKKIMIDEGESFVAYSTFIQKLKSNPLRFLHFSFEFVRRYSNQEITSAELLTYLNDADELAKMPKPLVLNLDVQAPATPPRKETDSGQSDQLLLL